MSKSKNELSAKQIDGLLKTLQTRFEKNMNRHKGIDWSKLKSRLESNPQKLWSLNEMEVTKGEPDVVGYDNKSGEFIFYDCATESPDRRNLCYDREALDARKENKPKNNAMDVAAAMGIELLTKDEYHELQKLGNFDSKTSSWLNTPPEIRKHGGAIFGDFRYHHVFIYHNGAQSYYAARGFRGLLKV